MDFIGKIDTYPRSSKDHLDGRYFGVVLKGKAGVYEQPLYLEMVEGAKRIHVPAPINTMYNGKQFCRVVFVTPETSHSMLLIINHDKSHAKIWNFVENRKDEAVFHEVAKTVFSNMLPWRHEYRTDYMYRIVKEKDMCNAYVLEKVLQHFIEFRESDIRRFATAIEENYASLLSGEPEKEQGSGHHGHGYHGHGHHHYGGFYPGYYGYCPGFYPGAGLLGGLALGTALGAAAF